ncbi:MAG: glycosyltransferase, partial [Planctomycetota bacterium]
RPCARGKFIFAGDEKVYVRGVTYGAFRPDASGNEYHDLDLIDRDFTQMAAHGANAVRIPHTTPPRALLDVAQRHGLWVMVGLSVEQEIGYLIDRKAGEARRIEATLREKVRRCAGHPALLCFALGNEVPASIVRWYGHRRVERVLERMYRVVKTEDPESLVTYVNYPTTEYLQLPFLDLVSFNVYLESQDRLEAYLARLQNIADDRPLLMSELGLDAMRNGEDRQAEVLEWQIRSSFARGCAGVFIFSWTDEWFRGGADVEDWAFGLTNAQRHPKPALAAMARAFGEVPLPAEGASPRISVVVCSYNGGKTIRQCCEGLSKLEYPDFEVIAVDDGSQDDTAKVAEEYASRVIRTENKGLSSARNTGLAAATGDIVAFIDDDAYPDRDWLSYLAATFTSSSHVAVGGPNAKAPGDGEFADCVAHAPGNPTHVLLTDEEAEHLPGCNMAFRREALEAVGGFDRRFRVAGDDVDICWRLRERGWTLAFSPAAQVWHHRRDTLSAFVSQQVAYGEAEGMLESKWRGRNGPFGDGRWQGRIYGPGRLRGLLRPRVYHGVWGYAPFQSIYERSPGMLQALTWLPEFYVATAVLLGLSGLGLLWPPLRLAVPVLALAVFVVLLQVVGSAWRASSSGAPRSGTSRLRWVAVSAMLHLVQPVARRWGRVRGGSAPRPPGERWRVRLPRPRSGWVWSETWQPPEKRLEALEATLHAGNVDVARGGNYDAWDLEVRGGALGRVRICLAVEDHKECAQMVRYRMWPKTGNGTIVLAALTAALAALAALDAAWVAAGILSFLAAVLGVLVLGACGSATASALRALRRLET